MNVRASGGRHVEVASENGITDGGIHGESIENGGSAKGGHPKDTLGS